MESMACSRLDVNNVEVSWDILNFSLNGKHWGERLNSPVFELELTNLNWYLGLYPKGYGIPNCRFVSLYILCKAKNPNIEVEYSFAILDYNGNKVNTYEDVVIFKEKTSRGNRNIIPISDAEKYIINDKLAIMCEIIRVGVNTVPIPILSESTRVSTSELSQDFQIIFENPKFTDVIVAVKGKTFNVHKAILSARSPVFAASFEHEMQENINSRIDIEDAEPNVIEEMLRYIYTGKVKDLNLIACELLGISDKYFLEGLKSMCEDTLYKSLSVENVLKILSLANLHKAKTLKTKAVEFSVNHAKEISQTSSLENLNVEILSELFRELALKQSK